ncbi:MAG: hypothetical protein NTY26_01235 [Burkholderiales bacterium]|nr:hypothetical protein [Burkholderiales bacterium]
MWAQIEASIEHALALKQPFPDQCHHHRRQQNRVEKNATPETAADDLAVEHQRGQQRQADHQHHLDQAEADGVEDGAPENVLAAALNVKVITTLQQDREVLGPGERPLQRHQLDAAGGGIHQVDQDRQKGEQAEHQQVRPDKQPA